MNKDEAIQLIYYEAFDVSGVVELLGSGGAPDLERFALISDAIVNLSKEATSSKVDLKLAGALLRIITESTLAFGSWDDEMTDQNCYLISEWEVLYLNAHNFLIPEIPFES